MEPDPEATEEESARATAARRTREALVDAAIALFAEQGLSGPSLDAICAHAGYTRGAFYVHFKTRDDLIVAAIEKVTGGFIDAIVAGSGVGGDGGGADTATIVRTFAGAVESGAFPFKGRVRAHQILEACARSEKLRAKYLELLGRARLLLGATLARDQVEGRVRADVDPDAVAQLLLSVVLGVELATDLSVPYDAARVSRDVLKMLAP